MHYSELCTSKKIGVGEGCFFDRYVLSHDWYYVLNES